LWDIKKRFGFLGERKNKLETNNSTISEIM
jgi:hypothetical protein